MAKIVAESGSSSAASALADLAEDPSGGRVPSPAITTEDLIEISRDERMEKLAELDEKNPNFKHSYQKPGVSPRELERKGMEIVEGEHHFDDPVAREPIEAFNRRREIEGVMSANTVERITDPENDIFQTRQPKKPLRVRQRRKA